MCYKTIDLYPHILKNRSNIYKENIAHYACTYNREDYVNYICQYPDLLKEVEIINYNTPVHLSLVLKNGTHTHIQKMFYNWSILGVVAQAALRQMLKTYNRNGYTVLHLAAVYGIHSFLIAALKNLDLAIDRDIVAAKCLDNNKTLLEMTDNEEVKKLIANFNPIEEY